MSSSRRNSVRAGAIAGPITAALLIATPAFAAVPLDNQTQLVRVTASSTDATTGWIEQAYDCTVDEPFTTPNQDYVLGPATPTLGAGSHVMQTGEYGEETELYRTAMFDGATASEIAHLSYATYAASTKSADTVTKQPAYLRLSFDTNADSQPDTWLYYEPANSNNVTDGVWQNWDTMASGQNWSTDGSSDPGSFTSLHDFAVANPTATLADNGYGGGVALIAGCAGQNQENGVFGVDRFAITTGTASQLFDFDPTVGTNTVNVRVTDAHPHGWNAAAYNDTQDITPDQGMAFGPGTPPAGIGSHVIRYGGDTSVAELWRSPELDGINVGDIRTLNYSTYQQPGQNAPNVLQQPAYLRLSVDPGDGSGDFALFYEPAINHNTVADGSWQTWNTADELWSLDGGPDNVTTLAAISAKYPNATITTPANAAGNGGLSVVVGQAGNDQRSSDFYVDDVESDTFNGAGPDTYRTDDFEPTVPQPSINLPSEVLGRSTITISGQAVPNSPVDLFEKVYGESTFTDVATTTAGSDGSYSFDRTVSKHTTFYVRNYDRTNSAQKSVNVRIDPNLTLSTTTGTVAMHVHTSPVVAGQTVDFYKRNASGTRTLLAERTTNDLGRAHASIDWPSGHLITVFATVTAPAGNLPGHSPDETIRVA
jgi:hypothetical protein